MRATTVHGITLKAISKNTGVPVTTLYDWKNGMEPKEYKTTTKVIKYLEREIGGSLDAEQLLLLGEQMNRFLIPTQLRICLNRPRLKLPVFGNDSHQPGTIRKIGNDVDLFVDYVYGNTLGKIDGAIYVLTDSLYKTFEPRSKIFIKRLSFPQLLHQGYPYYFIDINGQSFIRWVRKGKDSSSVILYSENSSKYPDQQWKKSHFLAVFEIRGILKQVGYFRQAYVD